MVIDLNEKQLMFGELILLFSKAATYRTPQTKSFAAAEQVSEAEEDPERDESKTQQLLMEEDLEGIVNRTRTWEQDKKEAELEKKEVKLLDMNIKLVGYKFFKDNNNLTFF